MLEKNYTYKYEEDTFITKIRLTPVKGINQNNEIGVFYVFKIGCYQYKKDKLIKTMGGVIFPEETNNLNRNEIHKNINKLNSIGTNYKFGTLQQCNFLEKYGYYTNKEIINDSKQCINILKENDLYIDKGIEFGKKLLIATLPDYIIKFLNTI